MSPAKNIAASIKARLLERARKNGEDFNFLFLRFVQERILYRLSVSEYALDFVLKGAALFTLWDGAPHRTTKDTDFLSHMPPDPDRFRVVFTEILSLPAPHDALVFDGAHIKARAIRENAIYEGIRLDVPVSLGTAATWVQIDIGFGDATTPDPIEAEYPTLLDLPAPLIRAYRPETAIAEKLHVICSLGMINTRMKDYFDIELILRTRPLDYDSLEAAIRATFERRQTPLPHTTPIGLSEEFADNAEKQSQWNAFLRRASPTASLSLKETVDRVRENLLPLLSNGAKAT